MQIFLVIVACQQNKQIMYRKCKNEEVNDTEKMYDNKG